MRGRITKNKEINQVFILVAQFQWKPIDLKTLAVLPNAEYDPANSNHVILRLGPKVTAQIFGNGTVQLLGKHSKEETDLYIDKLSDILMSL